MKSDNLLFSKVPNPAVDRKMRKRYFKSTALRCFFAQKG